MVMHVRNFFKGISFSQISAGALAAVTSFLLSAKIGIAGSVIGVAIGSIVSAVASQIYQNMLKASSEKIQTVAPFTTSFATTSNDDEKQGVTTNEDETTVISSSAQADKTDANGKSDAEVTKVFADTVESKDLQRLSQGAEQDTQSIQLGEDGEHTTVLGDADKSAEGDSTGRTVASDPTQQHAKSSILAADKERVRRNKRIAIIVSVVSALVAVGITAGVILWITHGQGTDSVVRDIVTHSTVVPEPTSTEDSSTPTPTYDATPSESSSPSSSSSSTSTDDSTSGSEDSDSSTSTSSPSPSSSSTESSGSSSSDSSSSSSTDSSTSDSTTGSDSSSTTGTNSSSSKTTTSNSNAAAQSSTTE